MEAYRDQYATLFNNGNARRIDVSSWPSEVVAPAQMPERLPYWGEVSNGIVKGAVDFER